MSILVCGDTGFVGQQIALAAQRKTHRVRALVRRGASNAKAGPLTAGNVARTAPRLRRADRYGSDLRRRQRETDGCKRVDRTLEAMGLRILKTPVRAPQANAFCERVIGTIRCECLDFIIPMSEWHVRPILREWVGHYNRGRSHASLGPGIPEGSIVCSGRP